MKNNENIEQYNYNSESFWVSSTESKCYDTLKDNIKTEILVVGAGLAGITIAYMLKKHGYDVVLIDKARVASATSANTTAKITSQHSIKYNKLKNGLGSKTAEQYGYINEQAIRFIADTISENKIHCDYSIQSAYVYTQQEKNLELFENEVKTAQELNLPASLVFKLSIPLEIKAAVKFDNQAQFHPRKYMLALLDKFTELGGYVFENTAANNIENDRECITTLRNDLKIISDKVIMTSHYPFYESAGIYSARMFGKRTYLIGGEIPRADWQNGMYLSYEEPSRTIRFQPLSAEKQILIVGGEQHKTGHSDHEFIHYQALSSFMSETFDVNHVQWRWSAQDYVTVDGLPFAGSITSGRNKIFIATGFGKWGMTGTTAAAMIIYDLITKGKCEIGSAFDPFRYNIKAAAKDFVVENSKTAASLISGKLKMLPPISEQDIAHLQKGEGKAFSSHLNKIGVYKSEDGELYVVDLTCPHQRCELRWNSAEKTWDCPCHASRFNYKGELIEGPSHMNLKLIDFNSLGI